MSDHLKLVPQTDRMIDPADDPGHGGAMQGEQDGRVRRPGLALVLGAGGLRGIAHIGLLQALYQTGIRPDVVIGTSAGALVGAGYAVLGWEPDHMADAARGMGPLAALELASRRQLLRGFGSAIPWRSGWLSSILDALEGRDFEPLSHGVRLFGVTCFDLVSRTEKFFHTGCSIRPPVGEAVLGSAALPLLSSSRALSIGPTRMRLIDGGLSRTLPVELALEPPLDAMKVLAVDLDVFTGWNERSLDRQPGLKRRYGERLMLLKLPVRSFGTIVMHRGDPERLLDVGRRAIDADVRAWLETSRVARRTLPLT